LTVLLLDTSIVYRWLMALPLPRTIVRRIRAEGAAVSILSPWEMLMKHQVGKLELPTLDVAGDIVGQGFQLLPIKTEHLVTLAALPMHHRDPFDRLLVAQAKAEGLPIVTSDRAFAAYLPDVIQV
jgi:PIN domain nuclease of toxin-antitoxin system